MLINIYFNLKLFLRNIKNVDNKFMLLNKMYPFIFQSNLNKKNFLIHINYHLLKETYIFNELVSDYIRNDIHNLLL